MPTSTINSIQMSETLEDIARRKDPNGALSKVVEMLKQSNEILKDMKFLECNDGTSHKTSIRTGLYNQEVPRSKNTTINFTDHTVTLEVRSVVNQKLVDIQSNAVAYRASEDVAFLQAMTNEAASTVFYGDSSSPEKFVGLSTRFSKKSQDKKDAGSNIIDAGGTGSNLTSIWIVGWGDQTVHGLYPKKSIAGFASEDKGVNTVTDADGLELEAYVTRYSWDIGLSVRDWRYVARIANIDLDKLDGENAPVLSTLIIKALHKIPSDRAGVSIGIYCREDIFTALDLQTLDKSNAALGYKELQGEEVLAFRNHPIRQCAAISGNETQVK